ncbi:amidase [Pseudomonas sp. S75]|uniref:amidase n=1 Tax=unclassified Pseudomonas TaxID=196821 RepID=UPI001906A4A1|nr:MULTISPECIES: amidase family protein [unclassified Pseudomonas]MBJ9974188.1 amidase [Pseudomonas sp. S30]MBK0151882.1 amidase [Pseudomonas sp. S75]
MSDQQLALLSADQQLRAFRSGDLSPTEVLAAQVRVIEHHEPEINALCEQRIDAAFAQARESERRYRLGEGIRRLEGITVALKNEHYLLGSSTDLGSSLLSGAVDQYPSPVTQRILDAGGIIHARTNVPEFCIVAFTRSALYGITHNPWNRQFTCGGSSGGSAAAVAAGFSTLASGSDGAGSIRMPAAYCGIVGLKPSYARVPGTEPKLALLSNVHNGPLARSVRDCAHLYNALCGSHPLDPAAIPTLPIPTEYNSIAGLRIAISPDLGYFDVCSETAATVSHVADLLRANGAHVDEVALPWQVDVASTCRTQLWFLLGRMIRQAVGARDDLVSDYVREAMSISEAITADEYVSSFNDVERMSNNFLTVMQKYDVMICPTLAQNKTPAAGASSGVEDILQNAMTYPFNVLSRHPALSVPVGMASHGVPIGLQIIGHTYDEQTVMRVGAAVEALVGWRQRQQR